MVSDQHYPLVLAWRYSFELWSWSYRFTLETFLGFGFGGGGGLRCAVEVLALGGDEGIESGADGHGGRLRASETDSACRE